MAPGLSHPLLWFKPSIRELQWPRGLGNVAYGSLAFGGAVAVRRAELGWLWLHRV